MSTADRIAALRAEGEAAVAAATATAELEEVRVRFLGRKAELPNLLRDVGKLPPEERGPVGKGANQARQALQAAVDSRAGRARGARAGVDSSPPTSSTSRCPARRRCPPATCTSSPPPGARSRTCSSGLGYRVVEGPEIDLAYYNFDALNHDAAPPGAGGVGHVLRRRRRGPAHADLADAGARRWSCRRRRCTSSSRGASTGPTTTPRTRRSSTRSRAWRSTRT